MALSVAARWGVIVPGVVGLMRLFDNGTRDTISRRTPAIHSRSAGQRLALQADGKILVPAPILGPIRWNTAACGCIRTVTRHELPLAFHLWRYLAVPDGRTIFAAGTVTNQDGAWRAVRRAAAVRWIA